MTHTVSNNRFSIIKSWITVMRLPFTTVAIVPFAVGAYLAYSAGELVSWTAPALGIVSVFFICIVCYLIGEQYDQEEDYKTIEYGRTKFSGGTLLVVNGTLRGRSVMGLAMVLLAASAAMGLAIVLIHGSLLLLLLGLFGMCSAVMYSMPPVRLVKRGIGELFIAVCYGWLPIVTGYMCASGSFPRYSYFICIPVALTIFNVIFINEFPDYEADRRSDKSNLLVRIGKKAGSFLYSAVVVLTMISIIALWIYFRQGSLSYLPVIIPGILLSLVLLFNFAVRRRWERNETLEPLCAQTVVLNHIASLTVGALIIWH